MTSTSQMKITISAVDKVTAVTNKINASMSKITAHVDNLQRQTTAFSNAMGLDRMTTSLKNVGRASANVAEKISGIIAPLAAVVGVGSIAAIGEMATKWASLGAEISRTSATIGVSMNDLQLLRGAAELAGVSADSLTGGLASLGTTLQDAANGRNRPAIMLFEKLHLTMKHNAAGAINTTAAFSDLAGSIAKFMSVIN